MNRHEKTLTVFLIVVVLLFVACTILIAKTAEAHYTPYCKKYTCKMHVIKPQIKNFLGPVGACESGTGNHSIYAGLRATSRDGYYLGRYQFGMPDWRNAGGIRISGKRDPRDASATDQAYITIIWLHVNGRTSWPNC